MFPTFFVYFIANNGIMAIMFFFCEKNIPPCKSLQIIRYWYTFAYFYSSWGPRVAQGCPKGAPRAPKTPFCPPQGHPRHHFGAPGSPKWAPKAPFWSPRVTKRHPKSSILYLFGILGHTFVPEASFCRLRASNMASKG